MDAKNEILDAIQIMLDRALANTTKIYGGLCKGTKTGNIAIMIINGVETDVPYYGDAPTANKQYRVFVPEGNMSNAFMVTGGGSGSKPSTGGVTSVNGKTGEVVLNAGDVGALSDSTVIPDKTSDLTNDSGYITSADVPVKSVNGKTGVVSLTATDVNALPSSTKIPTKTSDITNDSGYITEADVPTKTSELTNDSGFITATALEPYAKSTDIPTKVSQLENDSDYATESQVDAKYTKPTGGIPKTDLASAVQASLNKADTALQSAPVTSVNGETGDVQLSAVDVGALPNTTKIPSNTSDITNDSGFITAADVPTKLSELDNDAGYITDAALAPYAKTADIPTKTSQLTNDSNFATTAQVNAKYTKPTAGIPKSDLASGVQASLDKADTALQSAPVASVNTKTGAVVLTQDDVGDGVTYVRTHNDFTDAVKAQINTNEDNIAMLDSDIAGLQSDVTTLTTALGSKQNTITGGASTIADDNLTANRALISNGSGKVAVSPVTDTELGYLDGVTSNVQTQLDKKLESAPVTSVNGKTGAVSLGASDVGAVSTANVTTILGTSTTKVPSEKAVSDALSSAGQGDMLKSVYDPTGAVQTAGGIPDYVDSQLPTVNDATLTIQRNGTNVGTFTANASANRSIDITVPTSKGDIGLGNVDNVKQYSADNPPPYPVTSVSGKTGDVTLTKSNVGLGNVDNVKQYSASNPPPYPVTSVNGQTGAVTIEAGGGTTIVLSSSQPSGLKSGDYWYQIVT